MGSLAGRRYIEKEERRFVMVLKAGSACSTEGVMWSQERQMSMFP